MKGIVLTVALLCAPLPAVGDDTATPSGFAERPEELEGLVDEDEQYATPQQEYAFNPVQAGKELRVGIYYAKKGSHRAAAGRFLEATRWDMSLAEAYWRLGMAREKLAQADEAIDAYVRFLKIEPKGRKSRDVGKRLERLRQSVGNLPLASRDPRPEASQ